MDMSGRKPLTREQREEGVKEAAEMFEEACEYQRKKRESGHADTSQQQADAKRSNKTSTPKKKANKKAQKSCEDKYDPFYDVHASCPDPDNNLFYDPWTQASMIMNRPNPLVYPCMLRITPEIVEQQQRILDQLQSQLFS